MKRITVSLNDQQLQALRERAVITGVPTAEFVRRAINMALFIDKPCKSGKPPIEKRPAQQLGLEAR